MIEDTPNIADSSWQQRYGWGASRERQHSDEKSIMAEYFVHHDFLVKPGTTPDKTELRETAASILVNPGTTPDTIVRAALDWMETNWDAPVGPFAIVWYTPGARLAGSLASFRNRRQDLRNAADVFLFPGRVDPDVESVVGPISERFIQNFDDISFTYSLLSAHTFDIETGKIYFHFEQEIELQKACALLYAKHKYLFLDHEKFRREGRAAYGIQDLLKTSEAVTIYTVSSEYDTSIKKYFQELTQKLFQIKPHSKSLKKRLRLCIVGQSGCADWNHTEEGDFPLSTRNSTSSTL